MIGCYSHLQVLAIDTLQSELGRYWLINLYTIEVQYKKKWISSEQYNNNVGHWPSSNLPHRLVPDKGTYNEFRP